MIKLPAGAWRKLDAWAHRLDNAPLLWPVAHWTCRRMVRACGLFDKKEAS